MEEARSFFSDDDLQELKQAIRNAELKTSGEIRIHIENTCHGQEALDRAVEIFASFEMHKTEKLNGVLFYLAVQDHKFSILGDVGINRKVPKNFWEEIKNSMQEYFKKKQFKEGLEYGVHQAGHELMEYFPYQHDDINELPDEITFGD